MIYFAYGSNMSIARLRIRVSSARRKAIGYLYGYKLAFHKTSLDGSGKCDAFETNCNEDYLIGIVYQIDPAHRHKLDKAERFGYEVKNIKIKTLSDEEVVAFTYCANKINRDLKPYHWYKQHVLFGAKENDLPPEYIKRIESINSIDDHDTDREQRELSIHKKTSGSIISIQQ
jgi:hypothetical protein